MYILVIILIRDKQKQIKNQANPLNKTKEKQKEKEKQMKISVNFEVKQTNKEHEDFLRSVRSNIFAYDSKDNFDLCINQLVNADLSSLNKVDDTYIIECYVNKTDLHAFIKSIEFLNDGLLQDCTAVYFHDLQEGLLIGRLAEIWGEFNIDYFKFN